MNAISAITTIIEITIPTIAPAPSLFSFLVKNFLLFGVVSISILDSFISAKFKSNISLLSIKDTALCISPLNDSFDLQYSIYIYF